MTFSPLKLSFKNFIRPKLRRKHIVNSSRCLSKEKGKSFLSGEFCILILFLELKWWVRVDYFIYSIILCNMFFDVHKNRNAFAIANLKFKCEKRFLFQSYFGSIFMTFSDVLEAMKPKKFGVISFWHQNVRIIQAKSWEAFEHIIVTQTWLT